MTHDDANRWLQAYVEAWRTYDPAAIGALFTDDATYRYHPWDAPLQGREAIVADWLANTDDPSAWVAMANPASGRPTPASPSRSNPTVPAAADPPGTTWLTARVTRLMRRTRDSGGRDSAGSSEEVRAA